MSDYVRLYDFSAKDALPTGNAAKKILGSEVDGELDAIVTAVATKEDSANKGQANGYATLDASTKILPAELPAATETAVGALETATDAEAVAVTATDKIVVPSNLDNVFAAPPALGGTTPAAVDGTTGGFTGALHTDSTTAIDLVDSAPAFRVGAGAGQHLEFDGNDVQSKSNATTVAAISINSLGGDLNLGDQTGSSGDVRIYRAGNQLLTTTADGFDITDPGNVIVDLIAGGANNDAVLGLRGNTNGGARVFWDESLSRFRIGQTDTAGAVEEYWIEGDKNGSVWLRQDGTARLKTTTTGIDILGSIADIDNSSANVESYYLVRNDTGGIRLSVDTSGNVQLRQVSSSNGSAENWISLVRNAGVTLNYDATAALATVDSTANHNTSSIQAYDHSGTVRDVGWNLMPEVDGDASLTLDEDDVSKYIYKNAGVAVTVTLPSGVSGAVPPLGSTTMIANDDTEDITVSAAGTLKWFNGTGAPSTGNRTLAQGGVCTVRHHANTEWHIWGTGLS